MKGPTAMLWNYDVSDKEEAERIASLYGEDGTRVVEPGTETETGRNLVRRCGNELGIATWEAYDFDPDTWTCETFSNREAAELWLSGSLYLDECVELDRQLTQSVKRMAALAANMSGGRWTAGIQEYRDGRKSLSFQLSDETGFFLITSPICKASELALGVVRDRVREELADLDPYREALEACRRAEDSSIALDKLAFYEKLKDLDMPVLLGALAVATEQNQRALGRLLAACSPRPHLSMHAQTPSTSTRTSACVPRRVSICGPSPRKSPRRSRRPSLPKRGPRRHAGPSSRSPERP